MRVTLIQPSIGRRAGQKDYIGTWQMEPLTIATLAGLTPKDVDLSFYDDRIELINYDHPTDLVAITVETYTAKRAYQIASQYRRKNVPVVMGGFHATLCPEEVSLHAEAVMVGEAEQLWSKLLLDASKQMLQPYYFMKDRPDLDKGSPDRSIFQNKKYVPIQLIEGGRGCSSNCDFCAVQTVFRRSRTPRSTKAIVNELQQIGNKRFFFFVDDNISANMDEAKEFLRALIPLKIRWVSQMSLNAAHDSEFLELLGLSGCQGVLIGLESLNKENLIRMNKGVNLDKGSFQTALANLRKHSIRLYATFVFGYDADSVDCFGETVDFALKNRFFITAFNHLTPFPGTPLYKRLEQEQRLLYEKWWLDENYSYNKIPFQPRGMSPEKLQQGCLEARNQFYSMNSIWLRSLDRVNRRNFMMWLRFFGINWAIKKEISSRDHYPLGDKGDQGELIQVRRVPLTFSPEIFCQ
jgi:radical SAM superfamily enzyme YgiQ (UPF0313 family)